MRKLLIALLVTLLASWLSAHAPPAAAERIKLPDEMLGLWCLDPKQRDNDRETYRRGECGPSTDKPSWMWLRIGPRNVRAHELDCRILNVGKVMERRVLPIYRLSMRCWGEGEVGIDRIRLWLDGNALLVAPRRQWPEIQ
jgi:hypothetical protein